LLQKLECRQRLLRLAVVYPRTILPFSPSLKSKNQVRRKKRAQPVARLSQVTYQIMETSRLPSLKRIPAPRKVHKVKGYKERHKSRGPKREIADHKSRGAWLQSLCRRLLATYKPNKNKSRRTSRQHRSKLPSRSKQRPRLLSRPRALCTT